MSNSYPIPNSISHKQLNYLFKNASKDNSSSQSIGAENCQQEEELKDALISWSKESKDLLNILKAKNLKLTNDPAPKSLMALGAMEAHLNLALQALQASELDQ